MDCIWSRFLSTWFIEKWCFVLSICMCNNKTMDEWISSDSALPKYVTHTRTCAHMTHIYHHQHFHSHVKWDPEWISNAKRLTIHASMIEITMENEIGDRKRSQIIFSIDDCISIYIYSQRLLHLLLLKLEEKTQLDIAFFLLFRVSIEVCVARVIRKFMIDFCRSSSSNNNKR